MKKDNVYTVVGTNESGKLTLMALIIGLYPAREKVAYVDQNTILLDTGIFDNIKYGNLNASEEEVY